MQEFKVIANNYSAEFGHSTGGVVTMSTRSGTNEFHGSVFESLQQRRARCAQLLRGDEAADPAESIRRHARAVRSEQDKTFFFGSWERTRQLTSDTVVSTVPTLLNRQGDFSDLRNSAGQPGHDLRPGDAPGHSPAT